MGVGVPEFARKKYSEEMWRWHIVVLEARPDRRIRWTQWFICHNVDGNIVTCFKFQWSISRRTSRAAALLIDGFCVQNHMSF